MKKYFIVSLISLCEVYYAQQDAQYNMYQFNQMAINPAYAGARDAIAVVGSLRKQWVSFPGAPQTVCLSIHGPVFGKNIGVGGTLVNDVMGARNLIGAYGNFAYILKISKKMRLSFGLNAGFNRYQFDFTKINFKEGEVPSQLLQNQAKGTLDINGGTYFKMPNFFVGLSATHINNPKVYSYQETTATTTTGRFTYRARTHMFLTIGKSIIMNTDAVFAPTAMVKLVNNKVSVDVNFNFFLFKKMWLGAFYRAGYGPGALFQYYFSKNMRIAYSYDTGILDAFRLGGSHEIMFGYDFGIIKSRTSKMINPRFL